MSQNRKAREFVDQVVAGENIEAGETFKDLMQDKQLDAIDLKRVETQLDWLNQQTAEESIMNYENSWTQPGEGFITEAISLKWKETNRDNPQRFETTHKGEKVTLEWQKGPPPKGDVNLTGAHMHIKGKGSAAKEVAQAVAKHFAGQRIITLNGKVFSKKVSGFKNRAPDDYTTYRPGWKKDWSFTA